MVWIQLAAGKSPPFCRRSGTALFFPEEEMKKQWYRLDNAALIFPAIIRKNWNNVFRVSATLKDPVDPEVLDRQSRS